MKPNVGWGLHRVAPWWRLVILEPMRNLCLFCALLPLSAAVVGCGGGETDLPPESATLMGQLFDSDTQSPIGGAYVAIERGGIYVAIADPSKASPAFQYGALTRADGTFEVVVAGGLVGVHSFIDDHFYGSQLVRVDADPTSFVMASAPLQASAVKPTLANPSAVPSTVAPGESFVLSVTAAAGSASDPLSDEIVAIEPTTGWAGELDPPSAGSPGVGYPDGLYSRTITAPAEPGTYTYGLAVTTEGCVTGDLTTITLTVQ